MKNLKHVPNLYAIQNKVKTGFVLEHADYSKNLQQNKETIRCYY